jgi:two-component system cell cycle response regulator
MNILLLEDKPGDARLVRDALRDLTAHFELVQATTVAEALTCLSADRFDIALLALELPDRQGLGVIRAIHAVAPHLPLVVLTSRDDEQLAVATLQEGAQDYLVKGEVNNASLLRALRYATERQRVQLELLNLALVDDLTGLSNRKGFLNLATHHVQLAQRIEKAFLVGFIDLDGLKQINDTCGHQEGNRALVDTANVLRDSFRQSDVLARFGGDEFAVLVTEASKERVPTVIQRIEQKLRALNERPLRRYSLSVSIGLVANDAVEPPDLERLLQLADEQMYQKKRDKRSARLSVEHLPVHS